MARRLLDPEQAKNFAISAAFEVKNTQRLSCCVDGRYSPEEAENAPVARPGADAGDLMIGLAALRKLGVPVDPDLRHAVFKAAIETAGGPEKFRFHTDAHAAEHGESDPRGTVGRGCGHLKQAENDPAAYGLTQEDMQAIFELLVILKTEGAKESVLQGGHGEGAVVVVKSPDSGLRHQVNGSQAFVYQETLHLERLRILAQKIASLPQIAQAGVSEEQVMAALAESSGLQTSETLTRLGPNFPIYSVENEGGELKVMPAGQVPARGN